MTEHVCQCSAPGWCHVFRTKMVGRKFEICKGEGLLIEPDERREYITLWRSQIDLKSKPPDASHINETCCPTHVPQGGHTPSLLDRMALLGVAGVKSLTAGMPLRRAEDVETIYGSICGPCEHREGTDKEH